jgi:signal transduction histidine kinase
MSGDLLSRGIAPESPVLTGVLRAAGVSAMVLDHERRVLYANEELGQLIGADSVQRLVGLLAGDALGCVNAAPEGCGRSPLCGECDTARIVLDCRERGGESQADCVLTIRRRRGDEALELSVKAAPLLLDGEEVMVVTLRDISVERRREALERVFFHDVLNTITGLYGHVELLGEDPTSSDAPVIVSRIVRICERLRHEVMAQRSLLEAENGTLRPEIRPVRVEAIVEAVRQFFAGHVAVSGRRLEIEHPGGELTTDAALLVRVLVNMVKNAFEATPPRGVIRLACLHDGGAEGWYTFTVWNAGRIPSAVAGRIFRRRFSTKGGRGRGLGTYSMKLFGERYLGGRVTFSTSDEGTVFSISLPPRADEAPAIR